MTPLSQLQGELADREAIRDCLYRLCRGIDRLDGQLLTSVFWPGATVENSMFRGPADEWIASLAAASESVETSHHLLGNILIGIEEASARVESYWTARQRLCAADGGRRDLVLAGRYLDVLSRADGEWRVSDHLVVRDWLQDQAVPAETASAPPASARSRADASYARLNG